MKNLLLFLFLTLFSQLALAEDEAWKYDLSEHAPGLPTIIIQNEPIVTITVVQNDDTDLSTLNQSMIACRTCDREALLGVVHRQEDAHSRIEHFGCDAPSL